MLYGIVRRCTAQGELAFELETLSGVPATVVDPRPMQLERYVRRLQVGHSAHRAPHTARGYPCSALSFSWVLSGCSSLLSCLMTCTICDAHPAARLRARPRMQPRICHVGLCGCAPFSILSRVR